LAGVAEARKPSCYPGRHSTSFAGRNQERSKLGTAGLFARASCAFGPWVKRPWQERSSECFSWAWPMWRTVVATSLRPIPNFWLLLVLWVNDSEYSRSTGAKPILSLCCIYLVSPGARCCCCGSCEFLLLLLRAPTPPRPLLLGEGSAKKIKSPVASGMAFGHFCVGVGVVKVAVLWARSECK